MSPRSCVHWGGECSETDGPVVATTTTMSKDKTMEQPAIAAFLICMTCFCCVPQGFMGRHYETTHPHIVIDREQQEDPKWWRDDD